MTHVVTDGCQQCEFTECTAVDVLHELLKKLEVKHRSP